MPSMMDFVDPRSPTSQVMAIGDALRLRRVRVHGTCPSCGMRWRASADTEGAFARDFAGTVHCPDCFQASRGNPRLYRLFGADGRRLPVPEKERER